MASAQDGDLEQVIVTGSRIARPDFDSASPIVSVTEELFERSGSGTVESALNTLPQFVPAYTSTSNNPSNGGQANVSLRGLGPTATLVLVDGKRLMPANGDGVTDLNIIPSSLIESVEIITGGASAVYGSDALAGVVNFKLKRDFDGVEIDGTWGQTDRSDGTQYEAGLTAGTDFAAGRGSIVGYVGYADRELVTHGDREFSRYPMRYSGVPGGGTLGPGNSFLPSGSEFIEEGRVNLINGDNPISPAVFDELMVSYGFAPGQVPYWPEQVRFPNAQFGFNENGTLFTQGNRGFFSNQIPAVFNFQGVEDPVFFNPYLYTYNFAPVNALQLPLERKSAFARAEFELSDSVRIYAQGLYSDYSVTQQLAPTPLVDVFMPVDNPFVPPDLALLLASRPTPDEPFSFEKRVSETGPRTGTTEYDVFQVTLGLSGEVLEDWKYDVYAQVGANDQVNRQTANLLTSKIEELTFAPDGGVSICGGFDPFGLGSISPACMEYISTDASNHAEVDQTIAEVSLSGALVALPAGDLKAAFGVFYKEDKYQYTASPVASVILEATDIVPFDREDIQGFRASDDIKGADDNLDLYAELLVPLLRNVPGAESLEAVVGYRLSDYASAGSFDSWKAELIYQPIDAVRLRGSYQQAVRAPSVYELYLPQLPTFADFFFFPDQVDPCAAGSPARTGPDGAQVEALCLAQGIPASVLPGFLGSDFVSGGKAGGNPDLGPEEATTSTIGVVWTSRLSSTLFSSLQVSLDWYEIHITDKIEQVLFSDFGQFCYDRQYNPDLSVTNQWCAMFSRNPVSGTVNAFQELNRNAYDWKTSGVDAQVDWRFDVGPGQVGVSWLVSWLDSFTATAEGSVGATDEWTGTIGFDPPTRVVGASLPEWKSNLHLSYSWRDLTMGASWRYIDSMKDTDSDLDPEFEVPQVDYFDLSANYEFASGFLDGLSIGIGVENLTDEDPPIFPSLIQANTDPSQYDVFGRRYYASLRYAF